MKDNVVHDQQNARFFIKLDQDNEDLEGELLYERIGDNLLDFYHTEVPPEFRGRGLGAVLARAAFDYVIKEEAQVRITCTYLQKFAAENLSESELQHVQH